jgi:lipopolysaccharide biosynthesis glycosyltransferase
MRVICATDNKYILPLLVAVYSAKINASRDFGLTIAYFPSELSKNNLDLLTNILTEIDVSFELKELSLNKNMTKQFHITPTSYARLLLADQLSGIVMWLDADTLCLPGWDSIFLDDSNIPNGVTLSAIRDFMVSSDSLIKTKNQSIINMGEDYFNSGILLIDCDRWTELNFHEKWPRLLMESSQRGFEYADQCVLNFMCVNEVKYISVKYNTLATTRRREHQSDPWVLHFAGNVKPWHYSMVNLRIISGILYPKDVYKYLKYQSQFIQEIRSKNSKLGLHLNEERKRIRLKH